MNKVKSKRGQRGINKQYSEPRLYKDIESVIISARKNNHYEGPYLKIEELVKTFDDIELRYIPMKGGLSGSLHKEVDKWIMSVNKNHNINRQRFTIAHELGHYIYHKENNSRFEDTTFFRGANRDPIEYKANDFAAKILMPEDIVRKKISDGINELITLSKMFKVSIAAMKFRLEELGYTLS